MDNGKLNFKLKMNDYHELIETPVEVRKKIGTISKPSHSSREIYGLAPSVGKLRASVGNVLRGEVQKIAFNRWEIVPTQRTGVAHYHVPGTFHLQMVQLLQPEKPALTMMLPAWWDIGCDLILRQDDGISIDVQLENVDADMLLSYQEGGLLQQAAVKATSQALDARMWRDGKGPDPIAATVCAYALLGFGELDRLDEWTKNLMNWFKQLPDGLILRGEYLARLGKHKEACTTFLALPARGLPLFSEGLSYVIDRLNLYVKVGKPHFDEGALSQARSLLEKLQRYANFVDFSKPFLTYTGLDPCKPNNEPLDSALSSYEGMDIYLDHHVLYPQTSDEMKERPLHEARDVLYVPEFNFSSATVAQAPMTGNWHSVSRNKQQVSQFSTGVDLVSVPGVALFAQLSSSLGHDWIIDSMTRHASVANQKKQKEKQVIRGTEKRTLILSLPSEEADLLFNIISIESEGPDTRLIVEVTQISSSQPVARCRVTLRDKEYRLLESHLTPSKGGVTFDNVPSGSYVVEVKFEKRIWEIPISLTWQV